MTEKYKGNLELNWINKDKSLYYEYDKDGNPGKPIWVEKNDIKVSEPRILKLVKEYGDTSGLKDPLDNALIRGDNLLALRTLVEMFKEREEKDKVKCIYIDPPYNTGTAFDHYEDNLMHSEWFTMMRDRLFLLNKLLRSDGAIFVQISDHEEHYLRVILDEVFGRHNFVNRITVKTRAPSGFKSVNPGVYETAEYILIYAKNKPLWTYYPQYTECEYDKNYSKIIKNKLEDPKNWEITNLVDYFIVKEKYKSTKDAKEKLGKHGFIARIGEFALENSDKVFRYAAISDSGAGKETVELKKKSLKSDKMFIQVREGYPNRYIHKGNELAFYTKKIRKINGKEVPTTLLTNIWTDIPWEGIAREGNVIFKTSKKPERLIKRILLMNTDPDDIILDSFAGSGTSAAVAHKMKRRWITIEIGKHAELLCVKRLKSITQKNRTDLSGISKDEDINWKGGGGFRYYKLGESLLSDSKMNWNLNYEELAQALFMNFDYLFKEKVNNNTFFGKSGKNIAICIVAKEMKIIKKEELQKILEKIKNNKTTKITLFTNHGVAIKNEDLPNNITIKKIPESILRKYKL